MRAVKPPMHGRDHRPGGEDPIPFQIPTAIGFHTVAQAVTTQEILELSRVWTNDHLTFGYDKTNHGIFVKRDCFLFVMCTVWIDTATITDKTYVDFYLKPTTSASGQGAPLAYRTSELVRQTAVARDTDEFPLTFTQLTRVAGATEAAPWHAQLLCTMDTIGSTVTTSTIDSSIALMKLGDLSGFTELT